MNTSKRFKRESTSLECLPNELFVEVFGYLNGVDTIYAFSQLNNRIQELLNNYVKSFDFQCVSKAKFTHVLQVHNLQQCRSLRLSDGDKTPGQIKLFQQLVSFPDHLSQLEYLFVLNISNIDAEEFLSLIPLLKNLTSLTIGTLCGLRIQSFILPTLKHLTLRGCKETRWLMDLENLESLDYTMTYECSHNCEFVLPKTLKRLKIFYQLASNIDEIRSVLSNLPQLNTLALYTETILTYLPNGRSWEDFIVQHLPLLQTFQFYFPFSTRQNTLDDFNELIQSYSTPFYQIEKRWFIQCDRNTDYENYTTGVLYSLPYAFSRMPITTSSFDESLSTLSAEDFNEKKTKYYRKIRTLIFNSKCKSPHLGFLSSNIQNLILLTKLSSSWLYVCSNIRHLTISHYTPVTSTDFEGLLRHTPKLDSLTITGQELQKLTKNFTDPIICGYLSERIRSLRMSREYQYSSSLDCISVRLLTSIVRLFSVNCEHLSLAFMAHPNTVHPILRRMKKLRSLHLEWQYFSGLGNDQLIFAWLNQRTKDKNHVDFSYTQDKRHFFIWFGNQL